MEDELQYWAAAVLVHLLRLYGLLMVTDGHPDELVTGMKRLEQKICQTAVHAIVARKASVSLCRVLPPELPNGKTTFGRKDE